MNGSSSTFQLWQTKPSSGAVPSGGCAGVLALGDRRWRLAGMEKGRGRKGQGLSPTAWGSQPSGNGRLVGACRSKTAWERGLPATCSGHIKWHGERRSSVARPCGSGARGARGGWENAEGQWWRGGPRRRPWHGRSQARNGEGTYEGKKIKGTFARCGARSRR
jgi:hypothetical protein